jgi:ribosomal protein L21
MSQRMENRTKGFYGTLVSGEQLAVIAKKILDLQYLPEDTGTTIKVDDLVLIELAEQTVWGDPKVALVCVEGVGWEQDEYRTIQVPVNIGHGWLNGRVHISVEVIKSCLTDKKVDIAEYVRVFGDRLDDNVAIWQNAMTEKTKKGGRVNA